MCKAEEGLIRILLAANLACLNVVAQQKPPAPKQAPAARAPTRPAPAARPAAAARPAKPPTPAARNQPAKAQAGRAPARAGPPSKGPAAANHGLAANGPGARSPASGSINTGRPQTNPGRTAHLANGSEIRTRPNGQRSDLHDARRGIDVHYGLSGDRRVTVQRADHSRIVVERGGRGGYVQRSYMFQGREFAHRTYYANGRTYDRFYRPYSYRGVSMEVDARASYYPAGFYGWVYPPWIQPAPYAWGWSGAPW
jgi:hypothetical protein